MKTIKVKFIDWYAGHSPTENMVYRLLSRKFNLQISDNPDYILDGGLGIEHLKYDCIKILLIGENIVPDFNCFDYAIGFDYLNFGDRYLRFPLYALYGDFYRLKKNRQISASEALNRDFCSFIVSNANNGDSLRLEFFEELSKYKPVASGGRYKNNVGGPVADKYAFCKKYKFNIAFENSSSLGYTTEKIMQPLVVNSVPIYWGNPLVENDFSHECFVQLIDRKTMQNTIGEIISLDQNDDAYLKKCFASCFGKYTPDEYAEQFVDFFTHIFSQDITDARRLNNFGHQACYRKELLALNLMTKQSYLKRAVKKALRILKP